MQFITLQRFLLSLCIKVRRLEMDSVDKGTPEFPVILKPFFTKQLFQMQEEKVFARCTVYTIWGVIKKFPTVILNPLLS